MAKVWRLVAVVGGIVLIIGMALVCVAYATGGSVERLMATTDITDMTKFISRDQLEAYVQQAFDLFGRIAGVFGI